MPSLSRRGFMALTAAAGTVRIATPLATLAARRPVLRLVYDKSLGMMRAVDRLVP